MKRRLTPKFRLVDNISDGLGKARLRALDDMEFAMFGNENGRFVMWIEKPQPILFKFVGDVEYISQDGVILGLYQNGIEITNLDHSLIDWESLTREVPNIEETLI